MEATPKQLHYRMILRKWDSLNILPRCSKVMSMFTGCKTEGAQHGMTFRTPSTPGEVQDQFLVITIVLSPACHRINTLAGDMTSLQNVSLGPRQCPWLLPQSAFVRRHKPWSTRHLNLSDCPLTNCL